MQSKHLQVRHHAPFNMEPLKDKQDKADEILKLGMSILLENGIKSKIGGGTLLGITRDGKHIDHDTDLDVDVCLDDETELREKLPKLFTDMKDCDFELIRTQTYMLKPMQIAFIHRPSNIIFDIYLYYNYRTPNVDVYLNINEHGLLMYPIRYWNDKMSVDDYLSLRYGKDWKTPKTEKGAWEKDAKNLLVEL